MFTLPAHLQTLVGGDERRLVVDGRHADVNRARQTVLPRLRLIGHDGKAVAQGVAAVVDVGDVLSLHLGEDCLSLTRRAGVT